VITMAMKGKIRAMHLRKGKSISEIARCTNLSRNTIKKWLKEPAEAAPKYRRPAASTKLAPFVPTLTQALKADAHPPGHERRSARALLARLQASGYDSGYSWLTEFIRAWRQDEGKTVLTNAFVPLRRRA
jgi:transposase-like protein